MNKTEQFINKAKEIHGNRYDYSLVEFIKSNEKVIISCKIHNFFEQTPSNHLYLKQGCQKCANNYLSNTAEFIEKATKIHKIKYDYSKVEYVNAKTKVIIICRQHGIFNQQPNDHLNGKGCLKCSYFRKRKKTTIEFIEKAATIHKNKYNYSKVNYINIRTKVIIICVVHGDFEQRTDDHLRGSGCPFCVNKTEFILYEYLQQLFNNTITKQFKKVWCKNMITNKYLPFDFCIDEYKIIIELDGAQHFRQVLNWSSPDTQFENDKYKQKCANDNGYCQIRLLQEDVFDNKYDWKTELINNIEKIKTDNIIQNIYMCKNNEYAKFL